MTGSFENEKKVLNPKEIAQDGAILEIQCI